jgi:putative transcriptional regulator
MNNHPDIDFLLKYSSGQLEPALSVAIGVHVQECKMCQKQIVQLEEVGGAALESVNEELVSDELFNKLLADVEQLPTEQTTSAYENFAVAEIDKPFLQLLSERDYSSLEWQKVTRNISKATVAMNDPRFQVELLKFAPRAKIPQHTHTGSEVTVVLEGDFSDKGGIYRSGEFIVNDSSVEHQPLAGDDGCVCLAITDAPLKFTGTFGPIINWWVK